jgi:translation initiation factor 2 subunit 1
MSLRRTDWPEIGEFVIGTVISVAPHGAYVSLDEYDDKEGLIHISEISSSWVRNIRRHVHEGQKTVLQVLRVDPSKEHIDLSLRRVTGRERRERLVEWKRLKRGITLLNSTAKSMGLSSEEAYEQIGIKLEDEFGSLYQALLEAVDKGEKALIKKGISEDWAKALTETAKTKIKPPVVKIKGILKVSSNKSDGVDVLRKAFKKAVSSKGRKRAQIEIKVLGTPQYRIEVTSKDYKTAEKIMADAVKTATDILKTSGGELNFKRE